MPGPYFQGMCIEELACMYPERAVAAIVAGQLISGSFTAAEYAAVLATLPTSPPPGGGPWNNGGVITVS